MAKNPSLTSSYKAPTSPRKIQKGDKGFAIVDKAFKEENEAETSSYIPPQSPIAIQPGDKGFEIVGKAYNKWMWTFPEWKNRKSKIIDPNANWGLNAKPMTQKEIEKKMKKLYLKKESQDFSDNQTNDINEQHYLNEKPDNISDMDLSGLFKQKKIKI